MVGFCDWREEKVGVEYDLTPFNCHFFEFWLSFILASRHCDSCSIYKYIYIYNIIYIFIAVLIFLLEYFRITRTFCILPYCTVYIVRYTTHARSE